MRTWFRDLPIRRKLVVIAFASSALALLVAGVGFLTWNAIQYRNEIRDNLLVQSRILSENSAAPLTFNDATTAGETLAVLELSPRMEMACLYTPNGELFATYQRDGGTVCPGPGGAPTDISWRRSRLVTPVMAEGQPIGSLLLQRDMQDLRDRILIGAMALAVLLVLATGVAVLTAGLMQRIITAPLQKLAETAHSVSTGRDYSLRVDFRSRDELGVVVRMFNTMLDRVQETTDELARANRLKDEFLATLSHELRTPLNAVLGWAHVLRSTRVSKAARARALESIERNAQAQQRLIEDLLDISRIITGKLRLNLHPVDLADVIESALDIVRPAATAKSIRLLADLQERPSMTSGDPDRLQQVVWNLLSNAVKFTESGGSVIVTLVRQNGYILTVSDTGAGIDPGFLPQIFERFRQADASPSRQEGGLGIGLAIVRQIVEMHGGTIAAKSAGLGKGATFEVRLPSEVEVPRRDAARLTTPAVEAAAFDEPNLLVGVDVLVVDDEEDARDVVRTVLESYGAQVVTAASSSEAMLAVERHVPDVIVSDIGMAAEDGYALMRRVRARPPAAGGLTPAVALTAYASASDRETARAVGYQAHVSKPFDPAELARLVRRLSGAPQATPQ